MQSTTPYGSLNRERHEIRVFQFVEPPSPPQLSIHCKLETLSLNGDIPPYIALSYQWGPMLQPDAPTIPVFVDGVPYAPTSNLMLALMYLGAHMLDAPSRVLVWVDAICINQKDAVERGHQVDLMGRIYSCAMSVWCWLMPDSGPNQNSMATAAFDLLIECSEHHSGLAPTLQDVPLVSEDWLLSQLQDPSREWAWKGLEFLLNQPYWKRNWIVQEIM